MDYRVGRSQVSSVTCPQMALEDSERWCLLIKFPQATLAQVETPQLPLFSASSKETEHSSLGFFLLSVFARCPASRQLFDIRSQWNKSWSCAGYQKLVIYFTSFQMNSRSSENFMDMSKF